MITTTPDLPVLAVIDEVPTYFPATRLTPAAIRNHVFHADDRTNSRGEALPGNGLGKTGAIIRRGRRVYIDVRKYGTWLAGGQA